MMRLLTFLWNSCEGSKPLVESQLRQSHSANERDDSLFGPVIVDVVQHILHALPLRLG